MHVESEVSMLVFQIKYIYRGKCIPNISEKIVAVSSYKMFKPRRLNNWNFGNVLKLSFAWYFEKEFASKKGIETVWYVVKLHWLYH